MKTKDKSIFKWIGAICTIAVVAVGILLGTLFNKSANAELVVIASDIMVVEGESKPLEYKASIKNAVIRFRVVDKNIAEVEEHVVIGKIVGETEIIITARYDSMVYEKRIAVVVTEKGEEEKPGEGDDKPNSGDNSGDNNEEEKPPAPDEPEFAEIILSGSGCTITGNEIEIMVGKTARVTVFATEGYNDFEIESFSEGLEVKESEFSQRLLQIKANEEGEYEIRLRFDNKKSIIKVKVKG